MFIRDFITLTENDRTIVDALGAVPLGAIAQDAERAARAMLVGGSAPPPPGPPMVRLGPFRLTPDAWVASLSWSTDDALAAFTELDGDLCVVSLSPTTSQLLLLASHRHVDRSPWHRGHAAAADLTARAFLEALAGTVVATPR